MEDLVLRSPPKPSRVLQLTADPPINLVTEEPLAGNTSRQFIWRPAPPNLRQSAPLCSTRAAHCDGSGLEGALVEQALDSLPQVVTQVTLTTKEHSTELTKQRNILAETKDVLLKEQSSLDTSFGELAELTRKIFLTQQMVAEKQKACVKAQSDISDKITENENLQARLHDKQSDLAEGQAIYEGCAQQTEQHRNLVAETESTQPIHKEVITLRKHIQGLKEESRAGCQATDETEEEQLRADIAELKRKRDNLDTTITTLATNVKKEKEKHDNIKRDTEVLHKRNSAQLTRLRRQMKEAQSRYRQWDQQAAQLDQSVADLRAQLHS